MPYVESVAPVQPTTFLDDLLGAMTVTAAGPLASTGNLNLVTAGPSPILPSNDMADFTAATFGGYAPGTFSLGSIPLNLPSGKGRGLVSNSLFVADGTTSEVVTGYVVVDGNGNTILMEYFPAPIPMSNNGDFIDLTVSVGFLFAPPIA